MSKKEDVIVISGATLKEGGILSILIDCLTELDKELKHKYKIYVLVHKLELVKDFEGFEFIEYPMIKKSWFLRLYYEYIFYWYLSRRLKVKLWLSMHDITPNVCAEHRAVYCHNPSPFYKLPTRQAITDIKFFLFNKFYKYLYGINIKKNDYVIIQQEWLRQEFKSRYNVESIVAHPQLSNVDIDEGRKSVGSRPSSVFTFFYPSFARIFKNFEALLSAAELLYETRQDFVVKITISGTENAYAKSLFKKFGNRPYINFMGRLTRNEVFEQYLNCSCLVFPSKLETWGLPLSEFKAFNKPILAADLSYAKETIGSFSKVKFFNPDNCNELKDYMNCLMEDNLNFDSNKLIVPSQPFAKNWQELFKLILN